MRSVRVLEYEKKDGRFTGGKVEKPEIAKFHQFGCDYEEFEMGTGNYSTAIIEWPDGRVQNVPVDMIKFLD